MTERLDTIVLGGGAMGSATAWALAQRGRAVTLLERFDPGHHFGASHGATRNFSLGYANTTYLDMLTEALPLWDEIEQQSGEKLFAHTGVVNHGPDRSYPGVHAALSAAGLESEFLPLEEAHERWGGIRFDSQVLYTPQGGQLNADATLPALQRLAAERGAIVRHRSRVLSIRVLGDDDVVVEVQTADGIEVLHARTLVVTAGAWTSKLLDGVIGLPRLSVTQEQPAHFAVADTEAVWPGFNHRFTPGDPGYDYWCSAIYGMLTPGEGVKAGWHAVGPLTDPDARTFTPEPGQLAALQRYARDWLPGVDADSLVDVSCTYTLTADENFVLDRIGPIVVGAGFSGHGFKFVPVVGRILADLVTGDGAAPALFAANRTTAGSLFKITG
ncbi:FAD-dependent oxidoreductase [Microterricola viridarii]|uniref:FAD-dependent oxidoreductase n=1 Tax=Microterricola viridarii TaxID=412690 RepID=A0A0X8E1W1_9MICO|nr:FAD-dependent oxidoreductase [Microterricola viridarii]AMB58840.1 FAD-dependent oxidoreductase [Microterricola viridarii]